MPARAGNGEQVEQLEVVEAEHLDEARRGAVHFLGSKPAVELKLGLADGGLDTGDALIEKCRVVALSDKGDLVFQVGEAVIDRRGGENQNAGLDAPFRSAEHT